MVASKFSLLFKPTLLDCLINTSSAMSDFKLLEGLSSLPLNDQIALSHFGQGPNQPVPFSRVHEAFESVVDTYPDSVAAVSEQASLTYQELDNAANRLANSLLESGLQPRERICLVVSRSLEMLVGIFAVLKAGCQYVPIDGVVASDKQLTHIFADTVARHVLCSPKFQSRVKQFTRADAHVTPLSLHVVSDSSSGRPLVKCSSTDGCYAIYTSGTYSLITNKVLHS